MDDGALTGESIIVCPTCRVGCIKAADNPQRRIAELEQRQRWIPVSERLPEEGIPALVTNRKAVKQVVAAAVLYWEEDGWVWHQHCKGPLTHTASYEYVDDAEYTDWKPLLPPPEDT